LRTSLASAMPMKAFLTLRRQLSPGWTLKKLSVHCAWLLSNSLGIKWRTEPSWLQSLTSQTRSGPRSAIAEINRRL
jgi:hypothetical protein